MIIKLYHQNSFIRVTKIYDKLADTKVYSQISRISIYIEPRIEPKLPVFFS